MTRKLTSLLLALALLIAVGSPLYSVQIYDNGSQRFTITAGPTMPLSTTVFSGEYQGNYVGWGEGKSGFTPVGGFGSIAYQVFINPYVAIGGEIGYGFNYYVDDALLTNVPMQFKLTVMPLQGTVEIPLSFGIGTSYMSISDGGAYMPLFASFETGLDWYFTDNWGVGIKTGLWVIGEFYFQQDKSEQNALQTIIPITLSVTYRQ